MRTESNSASQTLAVGRRHTRQRVEGEQQFVGLGFIEIEDEYRYLLVRHGLGTKMPINQLQASVGKLADQQRIAIPDLVQQRRGERWPGPWGDAASSWDWAPAPSPAPVSTLPLDRESPSLPSSSAPSNRSITTSPGGNRRS